MNKRHECLCEMPMPERDSRYTQDRDYLYGNRPTVSTPSEMAAKNSTTTQKIAESGLVLRHPL